MMELEFIPLKTPDGVTCGHAKVRGGAVELFLRGRSEGRALVLTDTGYAGGSATGRIRVSGKVTAVAVEEKGALRCWGPARGSGIGEREVRSRLMNMTPPQPKREKPRGGTAPEPPRASRQEEAAPPGETPQSLEDVLNRLQTEASAMTQPTAEPPIFRGRPRPMEAERDDLEETLRQGDFGTALETLFAMEQGEETEREPERPNGQAQAQANPRQQERTRPRERTKEPTPPERDGAGESAGEGAAAARPEGFVTAANPLWQVERKGERIRERTKERPDAAGETPPRDRAGQGARERKKAAPTDEESFAALLKRADAVFRRIGQGMEEREDPPSPEWGRSWDGGSIPYPFVQAEKTFWNAPEQEREAPVTVDVINPFPHIFPEARFQKEGGDERGNRLEGIWSRGTERFSITAVRGEYSPQPPVHLAGFTRYIRTRSGGYWVRVRDGR